MAMKKGSVAVFCLLIMFILIISALGAAGFSSQSILRGTNEANMAITFDLSQATLEQGLTQALQDLTTNNGQLPSKTYNLSSIVDAAVPGATATAQLQPDASGTYGYMTSTVTYNGWTKSLRARIMQTNVGLWNNAIVAGCGASGQTINGNVTIAGSVLIFGEGEAFTDLHGTGVYQAGDPFNDVLGTGVYQAPDATTSLADSMSGSSGIQNNYAGMPAALLSDIPTIPAINGEGTLSANLRVERGEVGLSGTASVGSNAITVGMKNTVDGTYVTDGFAGNQGTKNVFSDNGTSKGYDLGKYNLGFPYVSGVGSTSYTASNGTVYANEAAYLSANALTCPVTTILSTTTAFSYSDGKGDSISFTPASGNNSAVLTVNGIVQFAGNLQIGTKDSIYFKGSGTLYDPGNINIDGNFLPAAGQTFPTTTKIGFIAQNINLATGNGSSQLSLAGAFYAQGTIVSKKQNQVLGTFMANYFNMGSNVPNIYQVPALATNLPPAMPGNQNIFILKEQTWKQVN